MTRENYLGSKLSIAESKACYDAEAKALIAEPQILSRILAECVSEYKGMSPEEIEEKYLKEARREEPEAALHRDVMRNSEDVTIGEGIVHYDLLYHLDAPSGDGEIKIYVNIEAQKNFNADIPKRAMYYASRLISAQHGNTFTHSEYGNLERVYSIWILPYPPLALKNTIHSFSMRPDRKVDDAMDKYYNGIDLQRVVFVNLGDNSDIVNITSMLWTLLTNERDVKSKKEYLADRFGIRMAEELKEGVDEMCNLSDVVFEKGIDKGRYLEAISNIKSTMLKGNMSALEAMDFLSIPSERREEYLKILSTEK